MIAKPTPKPKTDPLFAFPKLKFRTKSQQHVTNPKDKAFKMKPKPIIGNTQSKGVETKLTMKVLSFNSYLKTTCFKGF